MDDNTVSVRYLVSDIAAAVDFYTAHFGFVVRNNFAPAFADIERGNLRLLISGPQSFVEAEVRRVRRRAFISCIVMTTIFVAIAVILIATVGSN